MTIRIYRGRRLVKKLRADTRTTNARTSHRFRCTLKPGGYRFKVYATDLAGNRQLRVGTAALRVR